MIASAVRAIPSTRARTDGDQDTAVERGNERLYALPPFTALGSFEEIDRGPTGSYRFASLWHLARQLFSLVVLDEVLQRLGASLPQLHDGDQALDPARAKFLVQEGGLRRDPRGHLLFERRARHDEHSHAHDQCRHGEDHEVEARQPKTCRPENDGHPKPKHPAP